MEKFEADLKGVTFLSNKDLLIGGFYTATGSTPRPTAIILHGLPGIEKHLDIAYAIRDAGWNCLYFHFRGCWGSQGRYSLTGLAEDTKAAIDWVQTQECVDKNKIVLIAGSTGSHPALVAGVADKRIKAIVGISPVIEPSAFKFPLPMANNFANMLTGISAEQMVGQWNQLPSLENFISQFAPRPIFLIAAGDDDIFPFSDYAEMISAFSHVHTIEKKETDHGFSNCRPWLVQTVINWLLAKEKNL